MGDLVSVQWHETCGEPVGVEGESGKGKGSNWRALKAQGQKKAGRQALLRGKKNPLALATCRQYRADLHVPGANKYYYKVCNIECRVPRRRYRSCAMARDILTAPAVSIMTSNAGRSRSAASATRPFCSHELQRAAPWALQDAAKPGSVRLKYICTYPVRQC